MKSSKNLAKTSLCAGLIILCTGPFLAKASPMTYAVTADGRFGRFDLSNDSFYQIGGFVMGGFRGLGNLPDGTPITLDSNGNLWQLNTTIGAVGIIGSTGGQIASLGSMSSGALYGIGFDDQLYRINGSTSATSPIGNTGLPDSRGGVLSGNGDSLYYILNPANSVDAATLYRLNRTTGAATLIGSTGTSDISGAGFVNGVLYASCGSGIYSDPSAPHQIVSLDLHSGQATFVSQYASGMALSGFDTLVVPEPGAPALFVAGFLALFFAQILRRQSSVSLRPAPGRTR
ncbi:MAG: hypothetical protein C5B50_15585 [Verrucomicrobia bacterium]|nr:MAG: hypothetical protein C5B50_15585 [Verrucomicrobiota bacterium]